MRFFANIISRSGIASQVEVGINGSNAAIKFGSSGDAIIERVSPDVLALASGDKMQMGTTPTVGDDLVNKTFAERVFSRDYISNEIEWAIDDHNHDGRYLPILSVDNPAWAGYVNSLTPLGWWRLNDGSPGSLAVDSSGNNRPGTQLLAPTIGQRSLIAGSNDRSFSFDPAIGSSVSVPYAAAMNPATFSFHWRINVTGTTGTYRCLASQTDGAGTQGWVLYDDPVDGLRLFVYDGVTTHQIFSSQLVVHGIDHSVGLSYDGTNFRIYQDGVLVGTSIAITMATNTSAPISIGRTSAGTFPFYGIIDEPFICSGVLSAQQFSLLHSVATQVPLLATNTYSADEINARILSAQEECAAEDHSHSDLVRVQPFTSSGTVLADGGSVITFVDGASQTITLPPAIVGRVFDFMNIDTTDSVTVTRAGSDTIDTATSIVLLAGVRVKLVCVTNGLWRVVTGGFYDALAHVSAAQSQTATGTSQVVAFDAETRDAAALHDNVTNNSRLTALVAGLYTIHGQVTFASNATGIRYAQINLNGTSTPLVGSKANAISGLTHVSQVSGRLHLEATQYIELAAYQSSGANLAYGVGGAPIQTWLQMCRD